MQPGDIVRVNTPLFAQLAGKVGVVIEEVDAAARRRRLSYKVLVDGCFYSCYQESLEPLNATR